MSQISANYLFFIFLFLRFGVILNSPDTLVFYYCSSDDHASNFTYLYSDLNNLFSHLMSDAMSSYGFAVASVHDSATANVIYGLVMCYKDSTSDDCSACLDFSTRNATEYCPQSCSGIFFYESCFLHYEDSYFLSTLTLDQTPQCISNASFVSDSISMENRISAMLDTQRQNLDSEYLYAYDNKTEQGSNYSLYALVQCTRDLSLADCDLCLQFAIGNISACSSNYTSISASVQLTGCYASYKLYVLTSPPSSPSPHSKGLKSKLINAAKICGSSVLIFIIVVFVILYLSNKSANERTADVEVETGGNERTAEVEVEIRRYRFIR